MVWRIVGGLSGWIMGLAPLVVVNILAFTTAIDPGIIPIAGGAALLVGIALGGLLAGLLGGKRGGAWGGVMAGAIAGALFAASLIALMYALRAQNQLPYLLALHPIRTIEAIVFVACLVVVVAALFGALAGGGAVRRAAAQAAQSPTRPAPGAPWQTNAPSGPYGRPLHDGQRAPSQPYPPSAQRSQSAPPAPREPYDPRDPRETRRIAESRPRERSPRW